MASPVKAFADDLNMFDIYAPWQFNGDDDSWTGSEFRPYSYRTNVEEITFWPNQTVSVTSNENGTVTYPDGSYATLGAVAYSQVSKYPKQTTNAYNVNTTGTTSGDTKIWLNNIDPTIQSVTTSSGTFSPNHVQKDNGPVVTYDTEVGTTTNRIQWFGYKFYGPWKKGMRIYTIGRAQTVATYNSSGVSSTRQDVNGFRYWVYDDDTEPIEIFPDEYNCLVIPKNCNWFVLTGKVNFPSNGFSRRYLYIQQPTLVLKDMNVRADLQDQTDKLKDTTGSETVLGGVVEQNQNAITQKLGFIAQTGEIVGGTYDAFMNTDSQGSITFPGVSWDGQTIIAAQAVPVIPSGFEGLAETIRTFNTGVLALLWVRGVRHLYGRIFLNETDVIVDDE